MSEKIGEKWYQEMIKDGTRRWWEMVFRMMRMMMVPENNGRCYQIKMKGGSKG